MAAAQPYVELLREAGLKSYTGANGAILRIRRPVLVEDQGKRISILPADRFLADLRRGIAIIR